MATHVAMETVLRPASSSSTRTVEDPAFDCESANTLHLKRKYENADRRRDDTYSHPLEVAGVEFTNGDQPGVRLTKAAATHPTKAASASNPAVAAKAAHRKTAKATEGKR